MLKPVPKTVGRRRSPVFGIIILVVSAFVVAGFTGLISYSVTPSDGSASTLMSLDQPIESTSRGANLSTDASSVSLASPSHPGESRISAAGPAANNDSVESTNAPVQLIPRHLATPEKPITFDGRPLRRVATVEMEITAYSPDARSCGKWADGITASGYSVWTNGMKLVAADTDILPFGTVITVPGYNEGQPVPVLDRGGAIQGRRLDVLFPTHERALRWGRQDIKITVWEYADE